jgi:hypothetical protein
MPDRFGVATLRRNRSLRLTSPYFPNLPATSSSPSGRGVRMEYCRYPAAFHFSIVRLKHNQFLAEN